MIAVLRITGRVNLKKEIVETLNRLKLNTKLSCVFIDEKDVVRMGMLKKVRDFVSYGEVEKTLMDKIIEKRGKKNPKKEYQGYCKMHPPIGGFRKSTKKNFSRGGVLGNNKEINKLLERML